MSKKKKEWTITKWKEYLWKEFSQYIRLRDCIKTTGSPDFGRCVTCERAYPRKKLQAGHFVSGRTDGILFDEDCVHAQCYRCNHKLQGDWPSYYRWAQKHLGQEKIEELIDKRNEKIELTIDWIKEAYEYYNYCITYMLEHKQLVPKGKIETEKMPKM